MADVNLSAVLEGRYESADAFDNFERDLADLEARLDRIDGRTIEANFDFDAEEGLAEMEAIEEKYNDLDGRVVEMGFDFDGAAGLAEMEAVEVQADRMDGRTINYDVDVDTGKGRAELASFGASAITAATAVEFLQGALGVARLGGLARSPVGFAGALVVIVPLILGVLSAIGPLIAGVVTLGAAATTTVVGIGLLAGAFAPLIIQAVKMKEASDEVGKATDKQREAQERLNKALASGSPAEIAAAQEDLAAATKEVTAAQTNLNRISDQYGGVLGRIQTEGNKLKKTFFDSFSDSTRRAGELTLTLIDMGNRALPSLGKEASEVLSRMRREFKVLGVELGANEKNSLLNILDSADRIIGSLTRSVGRFGGGIANTFEIAIPYAERLVGWIEDMAGKYLAFTRSNQGKQSIKEFFDSAIPVARQLARFVGNVVSDVVDFGKKHGDELAKVLDLINDTLDLLFDFPKNPAKAGADAGKKYGGAYADGVGDSMNKKQAGEIADRWGGMIGSALGGVLRSILEDSSRKPGEKGGKNFGTGFIDGIKDAFKGFDWGKFLSDFFSFKKGRDYKEDSLVGEMIDQTERDLKTLGKRLKPIMEGIRIVIVDPFKLAYRTIVGNSIVPDLVDDVLRVLGRLVKAGGIKAALSGLVGIFEDIFGRAAKVVGRFFDNLLKRDGLKFEDLYEDGKKYLGMLEEEVDSVTKNIERFIRDRIESGVKDGLDSLKRLRDTGTDHMVTLREDGSSAVDKLRGNIVDYLDRARSSGVEDMVTLRERGVGEMKTFEAEAPPPVKSSVDKILGYFDELVKGMNQVAEEAGLDLGGGGEGGEGGGSGSEGAQAVRDTGGRRRARSGRRFAEGGIFTNALDWMGAPATESRGGEYTTPVRIVGEWPGMREVVITNNPLYAQDQPRYLETAAEMLGMRVLPKDRTQQWGDPGSTSERGSWGPKSEEAARVGAPRYMGPSLPPPSRMPRMIDWYYAGGIFPGIAYPTGGFSDEALRDAVQWARSYNGSPYTWGGANPGGTDCSGWQGHVTQYLSGNKSPSGRLGSTANMPWSGFKQGTGQYTQGFINGGEGGGHTAGTIKGSNFESNTETGGGAGGTFTNDDSNSGPAWGANNSYFGGNMWYLGGPNSGLMGGTGGGTGGIDISPLIEKYIPEVPKLSGHPGPDRIIGGIAEKVRDAVVSKLQSAAGSASGGSWSGGGNLEQWIKDGLTFGAAAEATPGNIETIRSRAMQESGGDPNAVNDWDSNAAAGNPSKGLMQIIATTWAQYQKEYGEDAGAFDSNWNNPVKSVGVASRYMMGAYGHLVGANGQGYTNGGFALKPQIASVAENGPEFFMPLHDPKSARQFVDFLSRTHPKGYDDEETMRQHARDELRRENYMDQMRRTGDGGGQPGRKSQQTQATEDIGERIETAVREQTDVLKDQLSQTLTTKLEELGDGALTALIQASLAAALSDGGFEAFLKNQSRQNGKSLDHDGGL